MPDTLKLVKVVSEKDLAEIRTLFLEYASSLGFDLCFQGFDEEVDGLPGDYAPPHGRLILARYGGTAAGCVALRMLSPSICEMKRMYVRPVFRGKGMGLALAEWIIREAGGIGYKRMRLDTVPGMKEAVSLYRKLGFKDIPPYRYNPIEGAVFMELILPGPRRR